MSNVFEVRHPRLRAVIAETSSYVMVEIEPAIDGRTRSFRVEVGNMAQARAVLRDIGKMIDALLEVSE